MRWLFAIVAGSVVLLATWPVLCMHGEYDDGSCTSALLLPVPGTAESADTWGIATSLVATTAVFLVTLRLTRRS